jgi:T5SS/PEP-CTERM-associated repeat protein
VLNTFNFQIGRGETGSLSGTVTITGLGTTVNVSNDFGHWSSPYQHEGGYLRVARNAGDEGLLEILDQAVVNISAGATETEPGFQIAREAGSLGTVLVDNATINIIQTAPADPANDVWGPWLQVGRSGEGHMTIQNGGVVSLTGENAFVHVSRGNTDEFSNPVDAPVLAQSTLTIQSGGQLLVDGAGGYAGMNIGREANGDGLVTVDGTGSLLSLSGVDADGFGAFLTVGRDGAGALEVLNGASVTIDGQAGVNPGLQAGRNTGSEGSITVSGAGSTIQIIGDTGILNVGRSGVGTLNVNAGGSITGVTFMTVGRDATGDGTAIIDGATSSISLSGADDSGQGAFLTVGREGTGTLNVLNGASVTIDGGSGSLTGFQAGRETGSDGTIVVDGAGSSITISSTLTDFTAGIIVIGRLGHGSLDITNGGTVTNEATGVMLIGPRDEGVGTVLVEGTIVNASTLDAGAQLVIGEGYDILTGLPLGADTGGVGTLTIGDFGTVIADATHIGSGGTLRGTGLLQSGSIIFDGGTIDPGFSIGTLTLDGNLTVNDATLLIEMQNPGTIEADLISVTGTAEIVSGLIEFSILDSFLPQLDDSFVFLGATVGLTADDTNISWAISGVTTDFLFEVTYGDNDATFIALNDAVAGTSTIFLGSDRDDVYSGGAGDDLLTGGGGADTLTGGTGADTFVYASGDGGATVDLADLLTDFEDGTDLIGLEGGLTFAELTISDGGGADTTISVTATSEILTVVQGVTEDLLTIDDFTIIV